MGSGHDDYRVHIDRHRATPAALADAQRAMLDDQSVWSRDRQLRRWQRLGVLLAGLMVVAGLAAVVVGVRSAGATTAYENCLADVEAMASALGDAQLDGASAGEEDAAAELCADYRR